MSTADTKRDLHRPVKVGEGPAYKNAFNLHEALLKVKDEFPPSAISEIYQNPTLTGGSSGIFPNSCTPDISEYVSQRVFKLNSFELISIDKIAILFSCPLPSLKSFWKVFNTMIDFGRPVIMPSTPLYRRCVKWMDDFYIQWDCVQTKHQTIRLELNPNKSNLKPFAYFGGCLKEHAFRLARVSRLDVAIDYAMYLNLLCWTCSNKTLSKTFENNSIPNTRYFGSPQSDVQIRIYNKAYELLTQQKINLGFDLWRVEAQIKGIKEKEMYLTKDEEITSFNPFERLNFYDQYGFINAGQGQYALFVACSRAYGTEYALSMLDYKTRKKYLQLLEKDMFPLPFNTPAEIYKNCFSEVYIRFVNRLFNLFEQGQACNLNH